MQQIRLCGLGGQGILISAVILAQAAFRDKKIVAQSSEYASRVRGGITKCDLFISDAFIDFPMVTQIDLLIAMLQEAYQESLPMVKKDGIIILDSTLVKGSPTSSIRHYSIPATEIAIRELNSQMAANIVLTAAANSTLQLVSKTSLEESIKENVSPKFVELNLKAMQLGWDLVKKLGA